jgi:hypothetical protein
VSIVKLAVLLKDNNREELLLPVPSLGDETLPPYLVAEVGDRGRQGLSYLVEISSLLALSREGEGIYVKHGPIVQQFTPYFSSVYDVDVDVMRSALGYAGLDIYTINEIVSSATLPKDKSKANVGKAALEVLRRLGERRWALFSGIVEDVSYSRTLIYSLLAEVVAKALEEAGGGREEALVRRAAREIRDIAEGHYDRLEEAAGVRDCFCEDVFSEIDDIAEIENYLYTLGREVRRFGAPGGLSEVKALLDSGERERALEVLEVAAGSAAHSPGYSDSDLIYSLVYVSLGRRSEGSLSTVARRRLSTVRWVLRSLCEEESNARRLLDPRERESCEEAVREVFGRVSFRYVIPESPPSCRELRERVAGLSAEGLRACDVAELVSVSPAIRVEWIGDLEDERVEELVLLTWLSSSLTMYKYPSQLLLVDKASRVSRDEAGMVPEIPREVARRRRPYTGFIRGWKSRIILA